MTPSDRLILAVAFVGSWLLLIACALWLGGCL